MKVLSFRIIYRGKNYRNKYSLMLLKIVKQYKTMVGFCSNNIKYRYVYIYEILLLYSVHKFNNIVFFKRYKFETIEYLAQVYQALKKYFMLSNLRIMIFMLNAYFTDGGCINTHMHIIVSKYVNILESCYYFRRFCSLLIIT